MDALSVTQLNCSLACMFTSSFMHVLSQLVSLTLNVCIIELIVLCPF